MPLAVGATLLFLMSTRHRGRLALTEQFERDTLPLATFIGQMRNKARITGTAIYMTSRLDIVQTGKPIAPNHCDPMSGTGLKRRPDGP
jgi:K+ transporter